MVASRLGAGQYRNGNYDQHVARAQVCLVDAYQTILTCDFAEHGRILPAVAGLTLDQWVAGVREIGPALNVGQLTKTEGFAGILRDNGIEPDPELVRALVDKDRELLLANGRLYPDALPFLRALRSHGVKIAIVSNCSEGTRELLDALGVAALADALVLSCEAGAAKPAAEIYQRALKQLGAAPEVAVFVDDQPRFCAGATALGITAVQIVRDGTAAAATAGETPDGVRLVYSLPEVEAMFGE
jgi:HAD superfamily hydrolase (TIGR01509 family)